MDKPCFSATSHTNISCSLLDDVEEPSLSSLEDSVGSSKDVSLVKEDSYSDGEAIRSVMTSTPQKRNEQRRSVSLVDVSKIDAFTSRPLGNMLASWETIGSQSSVGKSRDSGYIHSGSLLSINSAKHSEIKECSDDVGVILEEYNRLKRELEYSEVLINTLQESNNDLRMKCAAAHNRISELRLKCVAHCDCCSQTYSQSKPQISTIPNSIFLESSDTSSASESSRSPSPQPSRTQSCRLFTPKSRHFLHRNRKRDPFLKRDDSCSDVSAESTCRGWPIVRNLTAPASSSSFDQTKPLMNEFHHDDSRLKQLAKKPLENQIKNFNLIRSQTDDCSSFSFSESDSCQERKLPKSLKHPINIQSEIDSSSEKFCVTKPDQETFSKYSKPSDIPSTSSETEQEACSNSEEQKPNKLVESQFHSVEDLLTSIVTESEEKLENDKPVFVANEVNGKICVGNFRVWQKPIRVSPKSPFMASPVVTVRNVSPSFDQLNFNRVEDTLNGTQKIDLDLKNNVHLRVTIKPSPNSARPATVYSTLSKSSTKTSLSYQALNNKDCEGRLGSQNVYSTLSSRHGSYDNRSHSTINSQDLTPKRSSSAVFPNNSNFSANMNNSHNCSSKSISQTASNSKGNSCKENLSSLGVTVTKKERKSLCPESWVSKFKSFKLDKTPLSFLIQSDSSEKVESGAESSKLTLTSEDGEELSHDASSHTNSPEHENVSPHYSENIQDCIQNADQLSRQIAQLRDQLKHIKNIGKA